MQYSHLSSTSPSLVHDLFQAIHACSPRLIYIICPFQPVHDLQPEQMRPVVDVATTMDKLTAHFSLTNAHANPTIQLLVQALLPTPKIEEYEALFSCHEIVTGSSAASLLSSRLRQVDRPSSIQWEGPLHIPIPPDEGNAHTPEQSVSIFPGFQLTVTDPTFPQIPKLSTSHARILATAKRMPSHALFLSSRSGLRLDLSHACSPQTVGLYNMLADAQESFLLAIGHTRFWCFWKNTCGTTYEPPSCHAVYIPPLERDASNALDMGAWGMRQHFQDALFVRKLPTSIAQLSVLSLMDDTETVTLSPYQIDEMCETDKLKDELIHLSQWNPQDHTHPRQTENKRSRPSTTDNTLEDGTSAAELRALYIQQKATAQCEVALQTMRTATLSKSESCSILEARSVRPLPAKKAGKQTSQLTMRQQRFQRLMQSQREKQTVENAATISSLGQRGKRVRSISDNDMARRRASKVPRQGKGNRRDNDYLIHEALKNLKEKDPFFPLSRECGRQDHSRTLARQWSADGHANDDLLNMRSHRQQGNHGVEYIFDDDDRDAHIIDYEAAVAESRQEFTGSQPIDAQQQSKLIQSLCTLKSMANAVSADKSARATSESAIELLRQVIEGIDRGSVVVADTSLLLRLNNSTIMSSV